MRNDSPRMSPARSASTRSRVSDIDRMRARRQTRRKRRRRRRSMLPKVLGVLIFLCLGAALAIIISKAMPQPKPQESYPIRFSAEINAAADEFALDPAYLYAIVLAESSFRPDACSDVGALGLMQIMPDTGKWIAKKLDMGDTFTADMLTDPSVNVRFGGWYLRFLLDRYDGDMRCATAAYHAGQGTVDRWLDDAAYSPDGQTLAVIAFDSTDNYVSKVMKYYAKYQSLLSAAD